MNSYKIITETLRVDTVEELIEATKIKRLKFDNDEIEVSFTVKGDGKYSVLKILRHLDLIGGQGHSYDIVLDPDSSDTKMKVGWDGDGADRINDIKVDGHKLSREELKSLDKNKD